MRVEEFGFCVVFQNELWPVCKLLRTTRPRTQSSPGAVGRLPAYCEAKDRGVVQERCWNDTVGAADFPEKVVLRGLLAGPDAAAFLRSVPTFVEITWPEGDLERCYRIVWNERDLGSQDVTFQIPVPVRTRRLGTWHARLLAGDRILAGCTLEIISRRRLTESLRVTSSQVVMSVGDRIVPVTMPVRELPTEAWVGPAFLLSSTLDRVAFAGDLEIKIAKLNGTVQQRSFAYRVYYLGQPVLVAPGVVQDSPDLGEFRLYWGRRRLATARLRMTQPVVTFTSEGGFRICSQRCDTTADLDEQLDQRLHALEDTDLAAELCSEQSPERSRSLSSLPESEQGGLTGAFERFLRIIERYFLGPTSPNRRRR